MKFRAFASAATIAALTTLGGAAMADEKPEDLKQWLNGAGEAVDDVMYYPTFAIRRGDDGTATFEVTIDRNGNVKSFETTERTGHASLDSAARRVVSKADFPAIPANYIYDEMTFDLVLNYQVQSGLEYKRDKRLREGKVDLQELAKRKRTQTASIRIHSANGR